MANDSKGNQAAVAPQAEPIVCEIDGVKFTATTLALHIAKLTAQSKANEEQAKQALVDKQKLADELAAAKSATPAERPFKIDASRYSMTHEKTNPKLRGLLKGTVELSGGPLGPFASIHLRPSWFDFLVTQIPAIQKFVDENRVALDKAFDHATTVKGQSKGA